MIAWLAEIFGVIDEKTESTDVEEKEPTPEPPMSPAAQMAHAVMLVDLALIDKEFGYDEHEFIKRRLCSIFEVDLDTAYKMINTAQEIVAKGNPDALITELQDELSAQEREEIVHLLDELIDIDGSSAKFELTLRGRYERLLGVRWRKKG